METVELKQQLKKQVIDFLNLTDLTPESIRDDQAFFDDRAVHSFFAGGFFANHQHGRPEKIEGKRRHAARICPLYGD